MKTIWIILIVLLGLGLLFALYYFFFSETAKKKKEIKRILALPADKKDPAHTAEFLKTKTLAELQEIK